MVLAFLSVVKSQAEVAVQIEHIEGAGTPARNVARLEAFGVAVEFHEHGRTGDLQHAIDAGHAPIVFLRTGELPYWDADVPHAVVVVGIEADVIFVNDPAFDSAPIPVPNGD